MSAVLADAFARFEAAEADARALIEATPRFAEHPEHCAQAYVSLAEARTMAYNHVINHQTDVNMRTAVLDPDGRLRVVIADRDTGHANWLDTCGRSEGELATRNYRAAGAVPGRLRGLTRKVN